MIKDGMSNYEIMEANPDYIVSLDKVERARQARAGTAVPGHLSPA